MKNDIGSLIRAAKRAAVPIVAIETVDPAQTIRACAKAIVNGNTENAPVLIQWDCNLGLYEFADARANKLISQIQEEDFPLTDPAQMLTKLLNIKDPVMVFMHNAHRILDDRGAAQGVWNVRDVFKTQMSMLVLLGPEFDIPMQLQQDIVLLSEEMPTREEIAAITDSVIKDANKILEAKKKPVIELSEPEKGKVYDTLTGMAAFSCEQQLSMCLDPPTVDMDQLWRRKQKQVEIIPGLSIERPALTLADIRGCDQIIKFGRQLFNGNKPPTCLWILDEIEKMLAGTQGDTSGTAQDQLGVLLTEMQDHGITGWGELGPPGAAKTFFPQCLAGEFGVPVGRLDLGAMMGSLVGQSQQMIRQAMKVARAISDGRGMFIYTCNNITILPPELRRRFTLGTWMFPIPTSAQVALIADLYAKKYELTAKQKNLKQERMEGWTGAEVKACCDIAWRTGITLKEAAEYVVPVSVAAKDVIDRLYNLADGRFLSANDPGTFQKPKDNKPTGRRLDI